jgi:ribosomal protein S18 acetylase RimI-like enzyme
VSAGPRFRRAVPGDVDAVVPLMHDSSREPLDATFTVGGRDAAAFLRHDFLRGEGIFGYRNQVVALDPAGAVVGSATIYPGGRYRRLSTGTARSAATYFRPVQLVRVARRSLAAAAAFIPPGREAVYLGNLCVAAPVRGRGYGAELIEHIAGLAARRGFCAVELDVAFSNPRAQRLYERSGFRVTGECADPRGVRFGGTRRMTRRVRPPGATGTDPGGATPGDRP